MSFKRTYAKKTLSIRQGFLGNKNFFNIETVIFINDKMLKKRQGDNPSF